MEFHRHSPEVNKACEELLAQTSRINPGVPSWRISSEAVEPKRGEIAQQLSQMKQESCRAQLSQEFSSMLTSSNRQHCINAFIQGNITPLTEALVAHERSQAQQQLRPQFSKGSTRDIHLALEGNRPAMVRVAKAQSQHQLSQQKQAKQRLESGFSEIGLGRDSKPSPMKGRCFWVPASVRHEVKKDDGGALTRHSFFVYGGVRIQPRINVIRGRTKPVQLNRFHKTASRLPKSVQQNIRRVRGWAKSKGYQKLPNSQGGPEVWGKIVNGKFQWGLKIKPEASLRQGLAPGSRMPRFEARVEPGKYVNPFTGQRGGVKIGGHISLENPQGTNTNYNTTPRTSW